MKQGRAVDLALELARAPSLLKAMRAQPLPGGTLDLIRIAAGCTETVRAAARCTGKHPELLKEASILYLRQVLFAAGSDCYRVLGVTPGASKKQMREHMKWLMEWLHPDRTADEWESVFAARVLSAWKEASVAAEKVLPLPDPLPTRAGHRATATRRPRPIHRWVALPLKQGTASRPSIGIAVLAAVCLLLLAVLSSQTGLGWLSARPAFLQQSAPALADRELTKTVDQKGSIR